MATLVKGQVSRKSIFCLMLCFTAVGFLPTSHAATIEILGQSLSEVLNELGYKPRTAEFRFYAFETVTGLSCKNCDQDGFIKKENIAVFGDVDTRKLPAAELSPEERVKYNGIGVFYCDGVFSGTGFLYFDDVIVTTAHTFRHGPKLNAFYGANECELRLPSAAFPATTIEIKKVHMYPGFKNDHTSEDAAKDVAVVELKYRMPERVNVYPLTIPKPEDIGSKIRVVGFHGDLNSDDLITTQKHKRKTEGRLLKVQGGRNFGVPRIFAHCADMSGGASGSPIFRKDGRVIGVNIAGSPTAGVKDCNDRNNHNLTMLFDKEVLDWMSEVLQLN